MASYVCMYVILRFTSPSLTLFGFTSLNFVFSLNSIFAVIRFTSPVFLINCNVNRGITVNSYNFFKLLFKNILLCSMSNIEFDVHHFGLRCLFFWNQLRRKSRDYCTTFLVYSVVSHTLVYCGKIACCSFKNWIQSFWIFPIILYFFFCDLQCG